MSMMGTVRRFRGAFRCPVCGGADDDPRGQGRRCSGFVSGDGWAHCSREEHAHGLAPEANGTFAHCMDAPCRCGVDHRAGGPALPAPSRPVQAAPRIVRTSRFEIRDATGVAQAVHVREDLADGGKRLRWERPDGAPGLGGRRVDSLPLYRTEILVAAPADRPVVLCEGEAKSDRLVAVAGDAVAVLGTVTGAGGTPSDDVLRPLTGRLTFLWPDNDEVGRVHMQRIAAVLLRLGARDVCMLDWSEAGPGEDAADWAARGGTLDGLRALARAARPWEPTRPAVGEAAPPPANATAEEWPDPIPLDGPAPPPFPLNVLPSDVARYAGEVARAFQVPADLPGCIALGVLSVAAGGRVEIVPRDGWREPPNIYTGVVLPPAERKSAVLAALFAPVVEYERCLVESARPAVAEATERRRAAEKRLEKLREKSARSDDPDERHSMTDECVRLAREIEMMPGAILPRVIVQDATPERLVGLLADHGRLAVVSAEGGLLDALTGRRYGDGGSHLDPLLSAHAGEPIRVDRRDRSEYVERPALTIVLALQPETLRATFGDPEFRGRGLPARFLVSVPHSALGRRSVGASPVPSHVERAYHGAVRVLLDLPAGTDRGGRPAPHVVRFSPDANARLLDFERELEPRLGEDGDLHAIGDWAGKLAGAIVRIAGLLHIGDRTGSPAPWADPVGGPIVERAIRCGRYFLVHAARAFDLAAADESLGLARRLERWIRRRRLIEFTTRDAWQQAKGGRVETVENLRPALRILLDHGIVRPGDRPEKWVVHPRFSSPNSPSPTPGGTKVGELGECFGGSDPVYAISEEVVAAPPVGPPTPADSLTDGKFEAAEREAIRAEACDEPWEG